jgi:long-chain acyl-CoA synthetase
LIVGAAQAATISAADFANSALAEIWRIDGGTLERCCHIPAHVSDRPQSACLPQAAALVIHTSGSSGHPKGVVISRSALAQIIAGRIQCAAINERSRAVIASSLAHSVGLYQALACIAAGATFILLASYEVTALAAGINESQPTHLIMVVAAYADLLRSGAVDARSFKHIEFAAVGADRVPAYVQEAYIAITGRPLAITYGMSELSWILLNARGERATCMALGTPTPGVEIRLLDANGEDVSNGETGEIFARSPKAMLGYLCDRDGSTDVFRGDWLRSGDLAYQDANGLYWFAGRIKELIVLPSGDLVAPAEVERAALGIPGIAECVVVGMPSPRQHETDRADEPWALVVSVNPALTAGAILEHLRRSLSAFKLPRKIIFVERIPVGESGKLSRTELRAWLSGA